MVNWKKVGMGVAAATIGSAAIGAVHFMFLAPQFGVGDFLGIPLNVLLPFLLGALGFIAVGSKIVKGETMKAILAYGSAAVVGFGVAQYAGWITPTTTVSTARARLPVARATMPVARAAASPVPVVMNGTKLI